MKIDELIIGQWPGIVAVNKPAGTVVVPGRFHGHVVPVLSHELGSHLKAKIFVVHRLDQGTTGALLFALTPESHRYLCEQFETRGVSKSYLCIVRGTPSDQVIDLPLFKLPSKKNKSVVNAEKGKPSQTKISVLKTAGNYSLVLAEPLTGRPHQIRVHLAHLGHPILGDKLYGGDTEIKGVTLNAPLLHSWKLGLKNLDQTLIEVEAELPALFKSTCQSLGLEIP